MLGKINFQSFFFLMKIKKYSDDYFKEAISFAKKAGVNVVGIGTEGESKLYSSCFEHDEITRTVLKFISAYVKVAQADL